MSMTNRRDFLAASVATAAIAASRLTSAQDHTTPAAAPLHTLSLAECAARIRQRTLTSTALVRDLLLRIDALNLRLNAFITVDRERPCVRLPR